MTSELDAYKQAYQREREARQLAERLLDEKSRQLYESVQSLEKSTEELSKRNLELESTHQQLIRSEKLASIGQLAAGVAHEINNPVGFVISNLDTVKQYFQSLESFISMHQELRGLFQENQLSDLQQSIWQQINQFEQQEDVGYLLEDISDIFNESSEGLDRVKDIVSSLKTFAHAGKKEQEEVDINDCLTSTLKLVNNELKYSAKVETIFGDVTSIKGSQSELTQVFTNLLVNAGHACSTDDGLIKISTNLVDANIQVRITDNGAGISPEHLDNIFDPFFTTKPVGKGTGLGLSISQSIIEKHFGTITVQSVIDQGTTFTILLPTETS